MPHSNEEHSPIKVDDLFQIHIDDETCDETIRRQLNGLYAVCLEVVPPFETRGTAIIGMVVPFMGGDHPHCVRVNVEDCIKVTAIGLQEHYNTRKLQDER